MFLKVSVNIVAAVSVIIVLQGCRHNVKEVNNKYTAYTDGEISKKLTPEQQVELEKYLKTPRAERPKLPPVDPSLPDDPIEGWPIRDGMPWADYLCGRDGPPTTSECESFCANMNQCLVTCFWYFDTQTNECRRAVVCQECVEIPEEPEPEPGPDPDRGGLD